MLIFQKSPLLVLFAMQEYKNIYLFFSYLQKSLPNLAEFY